VRVSLTCPVWWRWSSAWASVPAIQGVQVQLSVCLNCETHESTGRSLEELEVWTLLNCCSVSILTSDRDTKEKQWQILLLSDREMSLSSSDESEQRQRVMDGNESVSVHNILSLSVTGAGLWTTCRAWQGEYKSAPILL